MHDVKYRSFFKSIQQSIKTLEHVVNLNQDIPKMDSSSRSTTYPSYCDRTLSAGCVQTLRTRIVFTLTANLKNESDY